MWLSKNIFSFVNAVLFNKGSSFYNKQHCTKLSQTPCAAWIVSHQSSSAWITINLACSCLRGPLQWRAFCPNFKCLFIDIFWLEAWGARRTGQACKSWIDESYDADFMPNEYAPRICAVLVNKEQSSPRIPLQHPGSSCLWLTPSTQLLKAICQTSAHIKLSWLVKDVCV